MKKLIVLICLTLLTAGCIQTGGGKIPTDAQGIPDVCGCRTIPRGSNHYNK